MAYTVTVYVALPGTPLLNPPNTTSKAGHVWYKIADTATNTTKSYGFQSVNGTPGGPGEVVDTDTKNYQKPYYSRTLEISKDQYEQLKQYGEDGLQGNWNHFRSQYGGLANSCVDFTWVGLNRAGLNATFKLPGMQVPLQSFEGKFKPMDNIRSIRSIQAPFPNSPLNRENHNPRPKQSFTQWLLTENEQQTQPARDAKTQMAGLGAAHLRAHAGLAELSEKIGSAFPHLSSEQNERLTAYWANRCVRERMPVESIGRLEQEHRQDGRHLLHAINQNGNQIVTANLDKALGTPVEQSLNALQQAQGQQQTQHNPAIKV